MNKLYFNTLISIIFINVLLSPTTIVGTYDLLNPSKDNPERVLITSELISFSDGKKIGINGQYIGFILQILHDLARMQNGEKDKNGIIKGIFSFEGKWHTLTSLGAIEIQIDQINNELQQPLPEDSNEQDKAKRMCQIKLYEKKDFALKKCLHDAKQYFIAKVLPFTNYARNVQELMIALIAETCEKRNRPDSFLLTWSECEAGKEEELLNNNITSLKIFDTFITDLSNFLQDIIYSCPRARAEFLANLKPKMNSSGKNYNEHREKNKRA